MAYTDLRDFIKRLESEGELVRIKHPISADLEITEIADRTVKSGGPALIFENVVGFGRARSDQSLRRHAADGDGARSRAHSMRSVRRWNR